MIHCDVGPICIGSVLWDIIGRSARDMKMGHDVPGRIMRIPGGVAYNIAQELSRLGRRPIILTSLGQDPEGDELVSHCQAMNMNMDHVLRAPDLSTDSYMAIEDCKGLVAAVADAHSLERAGNAVLAPLMGGALGGCDTPFAGMIVVDGNLTTAVLSQIAQAPEYRACDLRVVPASPGKADRLDSFFDAPNACFYVNRIEAEILCHRAFETAYAAACGMVEKGANRAIVTDGQNAVCDAIKGQEAITLPVPKVDDIQRVTGAGDTFLAAHIDAEIDNLARQDALAHAVKSASDYVAGKEKNGI